MKTKTGFFDFAAEVGLTKHLGGKAATDALVHLCHIGKDSYVLDVGCGVGATPCYLAKTYGCRVVGVDISEKMVGRSMERAAREKIADRVEFRVADAQELPFEDGIFDAVITESVTVFPEDQQKAVCEYARVTKPGGCVGLNESTWLKVPPPPEVIAWTAQDVGANVQPQTSDGWAGLLKGAGLTKINVQVFPIEIREEASGILKRYGLGGMLRVMGRTLLLYTRSPDYRKFVRGVRTSGPVPDHLEKYFGYGLFVGRKNSEGSR